mgnify:FL=1
MGKFELKNGKIYMNFIARNSQVGRFLLKEKSINIEDTLLVTIGEGIFNKDTIVYKKKIIPKDWLIYSPDW